MDNTPLTDEEIIKLRQILKKDERLDWLYTNLLRIGAWVFGIAGALVAFRNDIRDLFSWIFTRGP